MRIFLGRYINETCVGFLGLRKDREKERKMLPKRLVFCGGGTRCLVFLQSLVELESRGMLGRVTEYWGTSAGALLAALMAITKSAPVVKQTMYAADYRKFRDIDVSNLINITTTWGMDDGKSLTGEIERLFEMFSPGSKSKRFSDLPGLNVVVSDLNLHRSIVCNQSTFPDLRVVEAVRASMGLPFFFRPYYHAPTGHYWVDGGIRANFPWDLLPDDAARRESLGFMIEKSWSGGPKTFTEYIFSMIHFDEPRKLQGWKDAWPANIIWYDPPPFPAWFTGLKPEDFTLVETISQRATTRWLASKSPETPVPSAVVQCTPSQASLTHHTNETSGSLPPLTLPAQDSSPPPQQHLQLSSRRWSV
jgi:predicted acylesterase/phospholipase RssA